MSTLDRDEYSQSAAELRMTDTDVDCALTTQRQGRRHDQVSFAELMTTCCAVLTTVLIIIAMTKGRLRDAVIMASVGALLFVGSAVIVGWWVGLVNRTANRIEGEQ